MPRSVYKQTAFSDEDSYKLIQLPKEILEYVVEGKGGIQLKAAEDKAGGGLVLCTQESTYKVRQMNHSNTVLLCNDMNVNSGGMVISKSQDCDDKDDLVAFASLTYEYELSKTKGSINTVGLFEYDGVTEPYGPSIDELKDRSLISEQEFLDQWYSVGGCIIDGKAMILSRDLITETLHSVLTVISAEGNTYDEALKKDEIFKSMVEHSCNNKLEIVSTVLNKFTDENGKLKHEQVTTWFGLQLLSQLSGPTEINDFLMNWKASLPTFYNVPIDIVQLRGNYFRPNSNCIRYISSEMLVSKDLSSRVKELFALSKEWDWEDFLPYIKDFIAPGKKAESVILKFAKLKKIGEKRIVCPR